MHSWPQCIFSARWYDSSVTRALLPSAIVKLYLRSVLTLYEPVRIVIRGATKGPASYSQGPETGPHLRLRGTKKPCSTYVLRNVVIIYKRISACI